MHETIRGVCLVLAAAFAAGCGSGSRPMTGPPPHPVHGQVLVDGEPAEGVLVRFVPADDGGAELPLATGLTDEDGTFELSTYNPKDGAPAGQYQVALSWIKIVDPAATRQNQPPSAEQMPPKYRDPRMSGLTADIDEGSNDLEPFEVSTAK